MAILEPEKTTSDVFWVDLTRMSFDNSVTHKLRRLLQESGAMADLEGMRMALKVNTAENGYEYGLRPGIVRVVASGAQEASGSRPMISDGLKLVDYWNGAKGHEFLDVARANGYSTATLGGSFVINGGYSGDEGNLYSCGNPDSMLGGVEVGSAVCRNDALWVLSHVTFHPLFGLAGALWNGGFECLTGRERTRVLEGTDAYSFNGEKPSAEKLQRLRRRALESVLGVRSSVEGRVTYVNVMWDVTPQPEYFPFSGVPVIENLGFLASQNPVALDAATFAALEPALSAEDREAVRDFGEILRAAESLGLGSARPIVHRLS
jgi:uncharacterized Fe-S center protein